MLGNKASPNAALVGDDHLPDLSSHSHKHVHVLPHTETGNAEVVRGWSG